MKILEKNNEIYTIEYEEEDFSDGFSYLLSDIKTMIGYTNLEPEALKENRVFIIDGSTFIKSEHGQKLEISNACFAGSSTIKTRKGNLNGVYTYAAHIETDSVAITNSVIKEGCDIEVDNFTCDNSKILAPLRIYSTAIVIKDSIIAEITALNSKHIKLNCDILQPICLTNEKLIDLKGTINIQLCNDSILERTDILVVYGENGYRCSNVYYSNDTAGYSMKKIGRLKPVEYVSRDFVAAIDNFVNGRN